MTTQKLRTLVEGLRPDLDAWSDYLDRLERHNDNERNLEIRCQHLRDIPQLHEPPDRMIASERDDVRVAAQELEVLRSQLPNDLHDRLQGACDGVAFGLHRNQRDIPAEVRAYGRDWSLQSPSQWEIDKARILIPLLAELLARFHIVA